MTSRLHRRTALIEDSYYSITKLKKKTAKIRLLLRVSIFKSLKYKKFSSLSAENRLLREEKSRLQEKVNRLKDKVSSFEQENNNNNNNIKTKIF